MSYEQHCIDYALHGDPERDHWEYEEAARYDQYDGMRADLIGLDADPWYDEPSDPLDDWLGVLADEARTEENHAIRWAESVAPPVPF